MDSIATGTGSGPSSIDPEMFAFRDTMAIEFGTWITAAKLLNRLGVVFVWFRAGMPTRKLPRIVSAYTRPWQLKNRKNTIYANEPRN